MTFSYTTWMEKIALDFATWKIVGKSEPERYDSQMGVQNGDDSHGIK